MRTTRNALGGFMAPLVGRMHPGRAVSHQASENPAIDRIALLPISAPTEFHIEDRTLTAPFMPTHGYLSMIDQRKRSVARQRMDCVLDLLGTKLTAELYRLLKETGFETTLIKSVKRLPNCRDAVDFKALPTRDAVLHVSFTGVGMATSNWSTDYGPRVNARACLLARPDASSWLTNDHFYYGADSSGDTCFSIPTDPRHRYPSYNPLIDRVDDMPRVFEVAVDAIAKRISQQLSAQFGAKPLQLPNHE